MRKLDKDINLIRRFNRRYVPAMQILDRTYLGTGLSAKEVTVLLEISENEGCSASDLTSWLKIDKGYLSRVLSRYERDGTIERTPSKSDGRVLSITLTKKGERMAALLAKHGSRIVREAFRDASEADISSIAKSFTSILELLEKNNCKKDG